MGENQGCGGVPEPPSHLFLTLLGEEGPDPIPGVSNPELDQSLEAAGTEIMGKPQNRRESMDAEPGGAISALSESQPGQLSRGIVPARNHIHHHPGTWMELIWEIYSAPGGVWRFGGGSGDSRGAQEIQG